MHYYNVNQEKLSQEPKVAQLLVQVQDLERFVGRNMDLLLERGEQFDSMAVRSDELQEEAQVFYKRSKVMRRQQRQRYIKTLFIQSAVAIVVVGFILALVFLRVCGIDLSKCKRE